MNAKNLPLKFAFVAVLIAVCLWALFMGNKLRAGIDLRGGHSLIFEIRTSQSEIKRLEAQKQGLANKLAQTQGQKERQTVQGELERVGAEITRLQASGSESRDLPEQVISILKDRIDPQGLRSLEWRPLGSNRIEVRMPAAGTETQAARNAYSDALEKVEQGNIHRSELRALFLAAPQARQVQINALARGDESVKKLLEQLTAAHDAVQEAQAKLPAGSSEQERQKAQEALDSAYIDYDTKQAELDTKNVKLDRLQAVLANYVSPAEADAIGNSAEVRARRQRFDKELADLLARHPTRAAQIEEAVAKYKAWAEGRQQLEDPADLKRLIAKAGVLEYRIAPYAPGTGQRMALDQSEYDRYVEILDKEGPEGLRRKNEPYLWFPLREEKEKVENRLVVHDYAGKTYILLSNQPGDVMLHQAGPEGWTLKDARVWHDEAGRPSVRFQFDAKGAKLFGDLTANHVGDVLAVLLDDEVYSSPVVRSMITDVGTIEGNFRPEEVQDLVRILRAGSLPARLDPDPVAESTFGPGIGAENLKEALRAGYYSMIIVVAFMLGYYWLAGLVANVAMMLNVLMILGAMSVLDAVFTLPGIAGVILTIGMAVDANVLIHERLREEQNKGQSIRMALKNAYERAFSAIFDSNLTTLLTCLILGWVGTEEVRGFAITLGLGVVFNLFTAVWVTRWVFQAMLEGHLLKGHLHMLGLIGVPKINWMGLRGYFWTFSLATAAIGIGSVVWQGKNIWGIEFSAGTQAVIKFKEDALINGQLPNDGLVREMFVRQARKEGYSKLADTARVETIISPSRVEDFLRAYDTNGDGSVSLQEWQQAQGSQEFFKKIDTDGNGALSRAEIQQNLPETSYQVATTETHVPIIRDVAAKAFGTALQQNLRHDFKLTTADQEGGGEYVAELNMPVSPDGITKIDTKVIRAANPAYREELTDFEGGAMFILKDITPPITRADLLQRVRQMRFQSDFPGQQFNRTEVLGLKPAEGGYSSLAVLVASSDPQSLEEPGAWDAFAGKELSLLTAAIEREEAMVATNFDPAIAGETAQRAIMALVLSWAAIIGYLWFRFGSVRWGLAAVVCLIHDVTIAVGLVAASGWLSAHLIGRVLDIQSFKIDLTLVAALLTIIGYSVNDTIVVFDRIRENRGKLAAVSWNIINDSINQTLSRTMLTGSTTLFVVIAMYVIGGSGIHAFTFVLLVGITFGTYSSIAVAAPLLMGFRKAILARAAPSPQSRNVGIADTSRPSAQGTPAAVQRGGDPKGSGRAERAVRQAPHPEQGRGVEARRGTPPQ